MNRLCGALVMVLSSVIAFCQSKRPVLEGAWQAIEVVHPGPKPVTIKPGPNLSLFSAAH